MLKKVYQSDGNGGVKEVEIEVDEPVYITKKEMFDRLETLGKNLVVWEAMTTEQQIRFLLLEVGVEVGDEEVSALLAACGVDPVTVLY